LTYAASSLARNSAALATSQQVPMRPVGLALWRVASSSSMLSAWLASYRRTNEVSMKPGATALARIPSAAWVNANDTVTWFTAALLAMYAG